MPLPEEPLEAAVYGSYGPAEAAGVSAPAEPAQAATGRAGAGAEPSEAEAEPLPEFDPRHREPFTGLMFLGGLDKEFAWVGHRFVIKTLGTEELIEVSRAVKDYVGTDGYLKAWQAAVTGACVVTVDDQPLPVVPLTNGPDDTMIRAKARWVMRHWFPPVLDKIYEEYLKLELTVREVIDAMGKASG